MLKNRMHRVLTAALLAVILAAPEGGCVYGRKTPATTPDNSEGAADTDRGPMEEQELSTKPTLGTGDVFVIKVFEEDALSGEYRVDAAGNISFPLVGQIKADGKTSGDVSAELQEKLSQFLKKPFVSLLVKEFNSKKVHVLGQVSKPGSFPYADHMSIIQAITEAGGFTDRAAKNAVNVTRRMDGRDKRVVVEVDEIGKGRKPNFNLAPNDIVYIPEAFF